MLKDAGPAPDSAMEQPDRAVLLLEPLFAAAEGDKTWSCSQLLLQKITSSPKDLRF